ncbi:hypothetical protein, conserved [Leishmania tarentolae]|uniref:Uncharacterized protein n=1 Tax=Leishmania tarentolae TaxID=5689 RepID=A0A640KP05_LEITA|nr:hypothetical protein, conserved [Leishmania tarentolae]
MHRAAPGAGCCPRSCAQGSAAQTCAGAACRPCASPGLGRASRSGVWAAPKFDVVNTLAQEGNVRDRPDGAAESPKSTDSLTTVDGTGAPRTQTPRIRCGGRPAVLASTHFVLIGVRLHRQRTKDRFTVRRGGGLQVRLCRKCVHGFADRGRGTLRPAPIARGTAVSVRSAPLQRLVLNKVLTRISVHVHQGNRSRRDHGHKPRVVVRHRGGVVCGHLHTEIHAAPNQLQLRRSYHWKILDGEAFGNRGTRHHVLDRIFWTRSHICRASLTSSRPFVPLRVAGTYELLCHPPLW